VDPDGELPSISVTSEGKIGDAEQIASSIVVGLKIMFIDQKQAKFIRNRLAHPSVQRQQFCLYIFRD
jgi:hypothetical protein